MPETPKAVFLSYASQDADAARRIADALRAAGIEVWFDQSELRGGDAWDQKIRQQIKECALFVPVISANTQARAEGYFRLEWKLAVDRSHQLADDHPFLVPVVIDATAQTSARVPERFLLVQWMRFGAGAVSTEQIQHFHELLAGTLPPARLPRDVVPEPGLPANSPAAEARRLEREARRLIDDDYMEVRENFRLAEDLCRRAAELAPTNAEVWATWARASCTLIDNYHDVSNERRSDARAQAERAIRLAPDSFEAGLAMATYDLVRDGGRTAAERRLGDLHTRNPDDLRVLFLLAAVNHLTGKVDQAMTWLDRAAAVSGGDCGAHIQRAWWLFRANHLSEADAAVDRSLALRPSAGGYLLKLLLLVYARGDPVSACAWLEQIPSALLLEDRIAFFANRACLAAGRPDEALAIIRRLTGDFFEEGTILHSKAYAAGEAHTVAGRQRAAHTAWESALRAIERRQGERPDDPLVIAWKARVLARLGRKAEAIDALDLATELAGGSSVRIGWGTADIFVLLGRTDDALAALDASLDRTRPHWPVRLNHMRLDPVFAPLRDHPRFQEIVARGMAWLSEALAAPAGTPPSATPVEK